MATIVTGEQYMRIDGKLHEIKRQIRQSNGYPHDPERLSRALQAIVEGHFGPLDAVRLDYLRDSDAIVGDFLSRITEGWKMCANVSRSLWRIGDLEAVCFLRDKRQTSRAVSGKEMMERAVAMGPTLGFLDAVFALRHGAEITEDVEIVFPGTVLVSPHHDHAANVACLRRIDHVWHFVWRELKGAWFSHDRVARLKAAA